MLKIQTFIDGLIDAMRNKRSVLAVGLDPQLRYMPPHLISEIALEYGHSFQAIGRLFFEFNKQIIDVVADIVPAVKPQIAFYEQYGHWGIQAFEETIAYAKKQGLLVVTDAKRGDGSDTADAYADGHLGTVPFFGDDKDGLEFIRVSSTIRTDCMTIHPHIGDDCVMRFVERAKEHGTGIFVVDKTSFKPNSRVEQIEAKSGLKAWQEIAKMVDEWGKDTEGKYGYRNVGVVMGATYPEDAPWMREALPNSFFLVPGYGKQGGGADGAVAASNKDGLGCVVNSSRGIIYAYLDERYKAASKDFDVTARLATIDAVGELNEALKRADKYNF